MRIVSRYYLSESNAGAGLAANETSNAGLVLHNAVRDAHFTAERRQKDDELKTKMVTIITWSLKVGYRKIISTIKTYWTWKQTCLNWVHIMCNHNQLCLLLLNKWCNGVDSLADNTRALGGCISLSRCTSLSTGPKPLLLSLLALRPIFVQQLE